MIRDGERADSQGLHCVRRVAQYDERLAAQLGWRAIGPGRHRDGLRAAADGIETRGDNLQRVRVVDGDRDWRLTRDGDVAPVSDATLAEDHRLRQGHVYRTLDRIAKRHPRMPTTSPRFTVHPAALKPTLLRW